MAIWDKLRTELDRAGKVAQGAIDEGKLRLEVFRARQLVDRAAQSLGYAVYRSRTGKETPNDLLVARLVDAVRAREEELAELEERMRSVTGRSVPREDVPVGDAPPPREEGAGAPSAGAASPEAPRAASESSPPTP